MALACSCELQIGSIASRAQRLVQMHRAAAGHQEDVLHALIGDKAHNVVGELHAILPLQMIRKSLRFSGLRRLPVHSGHAMRAMRQPIRGRRRCRRIFGDEIGVWPEHLAWRLRAPLRKPAMCIAGRSLTSSPMKQICVSSIPAGYGELAQCGCFVPASLVRRAGYAFCCASGPPADCLRRRSAPTPIPALAGQRDAHDVGEAEALPLFAVRAPTRRRRRSVHHRHPARTRESC